jgi:hypothetical protein
MCKLGESICVFYLKISVESMKNIKSHTKKSISGFLKILF